MSKPRDIPLRELSYDEGHQHNYNEKTGEPHQHGTSINPGTDHDQDRSELQVSGKQNEQRCGIYICTNTPLRIYSGTEAAWQPGARS